MDLSHPLYSSSEVKSLCNLKVQILQIQLSHSVDSSARVKSPSLYSLNTVKLPYRQLVIFTLRNESTNQILKSIYLLKRA